MPAATQGAIGRYGEDQKGTQDTDRHRAGGGPAGFEQAFGQGSGGAEGSCRDERDDQATS